MTPLEFITLQNLENDVWDEELLGKDFALFRKKVLYPKERIVLELKVEGYTNEEICNLMKTKQGGMQKLTTINRVCYDIKRKFRLGQQTRVDNLPIMRAMRQAMGGK